MRMQPWHYRKNDLKKFSGSERDSNPRPLRYRCNALPTELSKPHESGPLWVRPHMFSGRNIRLKHTVGHLLPWNSNSVSTTVLWTKSSITRGWMRTDRGTSRHYLDCSCTFGHFTWIVVSTTSFFIEPEKKILSSFIDEVCTKLDFEQLFLSRLDWRPVT